MPVYLLKLHCGRYNEFECTFALSLFILCTCIKSAFTLIHIILVCWSMCNKAIYYKFNCYKQLTKIIKFLTFFYSQNSRKVEGQLWTPPWYNGKSWHHEATNELYSNINLIYFITFFFFFQGTSSRSRDQVFCNQ